VFSGMLNFVGEPDRRYPHRVESRWLASSCQFPLMGLMPCPCGYLRMQVFLLVVGLFFVYTAQHGYGDAND